MVAFIDRYRGEYGVEPICAVLPIAPSTYYEHKARQADRDRLPARAKRDVVLRGHVRRVWLANRLVYGAKKVWKELKREGREVARCTVARLMDEMGLAGAVRGKKVRTTIPDAMAVCPLDLVSRDFTASRPNELWVSDFTYVSTWSGWVYTSFVIDVFARGSSAGGFRVRCRRTWCSTPWSKRSGLARSARVLSFITATP